MRERVRFLAQNCATFVTKLLKHHAAKLTQTGLNGRTKHRVEAGRLLARCATQQRASRQGATRTSASVIKLKANLEHAIGEPLGHFVRVPRIQQHQNYLENLDLKVVLDGSGGARAARACCSCLVPVGDHTKQHEDALATFSAHHELPADSLRFVFSSAHWQRLHEPL